MSYMSPRAFAAWRRRHGLADDEGPITHPSQVDETIVGTVTPTRVPCDQLPADSPWRQPGQVCAPTLLDMLKGIYDKVVSAVATTPTPITSTDPVPAPVTSPESPSLLPWVIAGGVGYYLLTRKKRT